MKTLNYKDTSLPIATREQLFKIFVEGELEELEKRTDKLKEAHRDLYTEMINEDFVNSKLDTLEHTLKGYVNKEIARSNRTKELIDNTKPKWKKKISELLNL